ncbi:hypothetical protein RTE01_18410 [Raoultella terrigena]|nr:hypothetical protein RTE01_18410 [Raoultella terrigena]
MGYVRGGLKRCPRLVAGLSDETGKGAGGTQREVNYRAPFINSLNGALERWLPLTLASLKARLMRRLSKPD